MNSSNNPFLPQFGDFDSSFILNPLPAVRVNNQPASFMESTPVNTIPKASDNVTVLVQPPPIVSDRRTIQQFSGFMHEDAEKFLAEFESYLTLASIETTSPRAVAVFHLFLMGPALIWFNNLTFKDTWYAVKGAFVLEYCNIIGSPALIAESVVFDNLRLNQSQDTEDFHASIMDKGRKLHKSEADMLNKFISGLPSQFAVLVRAGRVESLREALQSAKIGEAQWVHTYG